MTRSRWIDAAAWTSICGAASALATASGVVLGGVVAEALVSVALTLLGASGVAVGLRLIRPSAHRVARAVLGAVAWVLLLFACAATVARLPISEASREDAVLLLLSPLHLVSRALFHAVDTLGPTGRPEPASMYLPAWAGWGLIFLSATILLAAVSAGGLTLARLVPWPSQAGALGARQQQAPG